MMNNKTRFILRYLLWIILNTTSLFMNSKLGIQDGYVVMKIIHIMRKSIEKNAKTSLEKLTQILKMHIPRKLICRK